MKLLQISDLHFSQDGCHSYVHLQGIERLLEKHEPTHLVITGDITDWGDIDSLKQAHDWIHDSIHVNGATYGLRANQRKLKIILVPGNHDAFNTNTPGNLFDRWQKSLGNFTNVFSSYGWKASGNGVQYHWEDDGAIAVFFCSVDSSHLGDLDAHVPQRARYLTGGPALGRIYESQFEDISNIHKFGINGQLADNDGALINAVKFRNSLKILVTHHYLLDPRANLKSHAMRMIDNDQVLKRFLMADFDILLCGHKHIPKMDKVSYYKLLDHRAVRGISFNYTKQRLQLDILPPNKRPDKLYENSAFRLMIALVAASDIQLHANDPIDQVMSTFRSILASPNIANWTLNRRLTWLHQLDSTHTSPLTGDQLQQVYSRILSDFRRDELGTLRGVASDLIKISKSLKKRKFLHITCASSSKMPGLSSEDRGINLCDISSLPRNRGHSFQISEFKWCDSSADFILRTKDNIKFRAMRGAS